jgi:Class II Aldolase and Adducin N-terminal domain
MKTMLFLGGNWVESPRESGYIKKLCSELVQINDFEIAFQNGGTAEELDAYLKKVGQFDVVLWFVNVPNTYEKTVDQIKQLNPRTLLITSKNNLEGKYSYMELVSRMLKVKSNLMVEFRMSSPTMGVDEMILRPGYSPKPTVVASVLDPLNNAYCVREPDVKKVAAVLSKRINELLNMKRIGSKKVGEALPIPDEEAFFAIGRRLADRFHDLIHPEHTERFLGNMSFRCESGFPSFRCGDQIYVSRRNIDKRQINKDGFVAVNAKSFDVIEYYGDAKPSVDTPVQVRLYGFYCNVKYMIHSHVYVKGAPITNSRIPCGAVEEVYEIRDLWPDERERNFAVNLHGHGSIVFAEDLEYFDKIEYVSRPSPER